jgi:serine/threonine protein kinase
VLGSGGFAVVYLLQQKAHHSEYPRQVALKVPYVGQEQSCDNEQHVLTHLRGDLPNVVQLLGTAKGSSAGQVVRGLVYEYCPDGTLNAVVHGLLRQAARDPEMQRQFSEAASILLSMLTPSGDWDCPPELAAECLALTSSDIPAFHAKLAAPLRQLVLDQELKWRMVPLLQLLVQMGGSSSGSSSDASDGYGSSSGGGGDSLTGVSSSATVPPGGCVHHGDIKPANLLSAGARLKLADWGVAVYFPVSSSQQLLRPKGVTAR